MISLFSFTKNLTQVIAVILLICEINGCYLEPEVNLNGHYHLKSKGGSSEYDVDFLTYDIYNDSLIRERYKYLNEGRSSSFDLKNKILKIPYVHYWQEYTIGAIYSDSFDLFNEFDTLVAIKMDNSFEHQLTDFLTPNLSVDMLYNEDLSVCTYIPPMYRLEFEIGYTLNLQEAKDEIIITSGNIVDNLTPRNTFIIAKKLRMKLPENKRQFIRPILYIDKKVDSFLLDSIHASLYQIGFDTVYHARLQRRDTLSFCYIPTATISENR